MKVAIFPRGPFWLASSRTRVYAYLPYLREKGIDCRVVSTWPRRRYFPLWVAEVLFATLSADLIFIQKWIPPQWLRRWLAVQQKPVVYDFDDALYASDHTQAYAALPAAEIVGLGDVLRRSTIIVCGNRFLAAYARGLNPNTVIIPTPIDLGQFRRSFPYRDHAPVVIGWIGHRKNLENLHDLDGVIENLLGEDERITFRIVSDGRFAIDAVKPDRIQSVLWSLDREVEMVAGFDIGIMPLRDNPWNQGKCAYKLLEYMALELPTVSSPVGVNQEIVRDAENGFLAASPDEWEEKLRRLVDDFALREQIGKAARASLADYALEANVPKLMSVFERAMSSRRASWVAP